MREVTPYRTVTRRDLLKGLAALVPLSGFGGVLAACAPAAPAPTSKPAPVVAPTTAAPAAAPTPTRGPRSGGNLTVATTGDVTNFDLFVTAFINRPLHRLYNTLLHYDPQSIKPVPELAESWNISSDGLTLTLKIRKGVKFHNGRTLAAKDVVENFLRAKDPKTGGSMTNWAADIKGVEATDDATVVVRYETVTADWPEVLTRLPIIAPEHFDKLKNSSIGTGPFKFVEWLPGDRVVLERFPDYWGKPLPRLDRLTLKPFSDMEALATALEAGTVEAAIGVPHTSYERLKPKLNLLRSRTPTTSVYVMFLNPHEGPFAKKEVRQGFRHAIDRETIVKQVLFGLGEPTAVPYDKSSPAYDEDLARSISFDLNKAKELFARAGYPSGFQASVMATTAYPETVSMAQILKADLAKIGVQAEIEPIEIAQWTPRLLSGKYQATFSFIGLFHTDPAGLTANSALRVVNNPLFPQGDVPRAYVDGLKAGRSTLDPAKRKAAYKEVTQVLLDEAWIQFISRKFTLFATQNFVKDFATGLDDEVLFEQIWLDK